MQLPDEIHREIFSYLPPNDEIFNKLWDLPKFYRDLLKENADKYVKYTMDCRYGRRRIQGKLPNGILHGKSLYIGRDFCKIHSYELGNLVSVSEGKCRYKQPELHLPISLIDFLRKVNFDFREEIEFHCSGDPFGLWSFIMDKDRTTLNTMWNQMKRGLTKLMAKGNKLMMGKHEFQIEEILPYILE